MHRILFELKKTQLGGLSFAREQLSAVPNMTPARFDLLWAIRSGGGLDAAIGVFPAARQAALWKSLGLHPSTVSKAVKRLVELGWVERDEGRRERSRLISLTAEGFRVIELARRIVMKRRTVRYWFDAAFRPCCGSWEGAHRAIHDFVLELDSLAWRFGRTAEPLYELPYILDD